MQYISEVIGDEYQNWQGRKWDSEETAIDQNEEGDIIYISAGTGTGKTFFIFNVLAEYAQRENEKILYLCNRDALKKDARRYADECQQPNVKIMSYQSLESIIAKKNKTTDDIKNFTNQTEKYKKAFQSLKKYKYIVADEMHYFLEDSPFNKNTHYSYNYLLERSPQVKILISATGRYAKLAFESRIKTENRYNLNGDKSAITLKFYRDDKSNGFDYPCYMIEKILNESPDEKILYFVESIERMSTLKRRIPELDQKAHYMFSKHAGKTGVRSDSDCIRKISEDEITFDKNILITTSVLSNGVTLKDRKIKHIFCEIEDILTAIQCIGRKRLIDREDVCNVYVKCPTRDKLMHERKKDIEQLEMIKLYERSPEQYALEVGDFFRQPKFFITDWNDHCKLKINAARKDRIYTNVNISYYIERFSNRGNNIYGEDWGYVKCFQELSGMTATPPFIKYLSEDSSSTLAAKQELIEFVRTLIGTEFRAKDIIDGRISTLRKAAGLTQKEMNDLLKHELNCMISKVSQRKVKGGKKYTLKRVTEI